MLLTINGEEKELANNLSLACIIKDLKIEDKVMAAALNMDIVKKNEWQTCKPKNGDKIELLQFVGGG